MIVVDSPQSLSVKTSLKRSLERDSSQHSEKVAKRPKYVGTIYPPPPLELRLNHGSLIKEPWVNVKLGFPTSSVPETFKAVLNLTYSE